MIIGASGYVGRHLCKILSKKYTVFGTFFRHSLYLNGESVFLDIRDKTSVFELLRQIRPQLIYHLAYDLKDLEGSIVRGTDNLLQAKRRAEIDVLRTGGIVVRPSLVYGFNPPDSRTATLLQGLETDVFEYPYFIDEMRCPIFVEDLCSALFELSNADNNKINILHIAGPETISRYEFACKLAHFLGHDPEKIPRGIQLDSGEIRPLNLSMDISLAKTLFQTKLRSIEEVLGG